MIVGNDGGPEVTTDGGETWHAALLPIGQFYHVSADNRVPFRVAGAQQDLGTAQGPSNSLATGGIDPADWYTVGGGEAGHVVSDWSNPDIVYAGDTWASSRPTTTPRGKCASPAPGPTTPRAGPQRT